MFTIHQIEEINAQVKSGADFPQFVQDLIQLGVLRFDTYVSDGHSVYFGRYGFNLESAADYDPLTVFDNSDVEVFKHCLKIHQQGETDYPTFCLDAANAGIEKWTVDMKAMTCTYYDKASKAIVVEEIPIS